MADQESYTISKGKSLASGFSSRWKKKLDDDEKAQADAQTLAQSKADAQAKEQKDNEDSKPLWQKAGDWIGTKAKQVGAGIEQGVGDVADVAIEGGTLLGTIGQNEKNTEAAVNSGQALRDKLHSLKDITGNNIGGTTDVDQNATNIATGHGSARDVAAVAGKGLEVGLDATQFANPSRLLTNGLIKEGGEQAVKTGVKDVAETAAKDTAKQATKMTTKQAAKFAARDAAFYGGSNAVATGAETYGKTGDVGESVKEGAKAGLLSGATQGALDIAGHTAGSVIGRLKNGPTEAVAKDGTKAADDVASDGANAADDSGTQFSKISDDELQKQLDQFQSGERTGDTKQDYSRYAELKDEQAHRQNQADKASFTSNGLPNDVEGAQKALDDHDAGNLPDEAYKPAAPVKSTEEILARPDVPVEIKSAAKEVQDDRNMVRNQMSNLMSPDTKNAELNRMDEQYAIKQDQISQLPPQRQALEQASLDQEYKERAAELDMLEEKDRPEVEKYNGILDKLNTREQQVIMDTRDLQKAAPNDFRDVDQPEADAIRQRLADNLEQAKRFNEPARIVQSVADSENPGKSFDRNPDAPEAFRKEITDQISDIPEETIKSNFKNITGITQAALRLMSPSQVLEKWGLRGTAVDLHTNILRGESLLNVANRDDSKVLTEISKILPKNKDAQNQIIDYLQGKRQTLSAIDDTKSADMIRDWLDTKREGLKSMGYKTMDDYFPHMFDKNDPDVARLFKGKTTGDITFNNLKSRIQNSDDYSRDIMNVLSKYASSYNRKAFIEPVLKPLENLKTQVELSKAEGSWVDDYINQMKGIKDSKLADSYNQVMDSVFDKIGLKSKVGQDHLSQALGTQRMVSALATMGGNLGTAVRQGTQMVNTIADIGPRYSTIGAIDGTRMLATKEGRAELQRVGIIDSGVSQNYYDALTKPGVVGRAVKVRDNAVKAMMSMIRGTDIAMRAQAYAGAKALAAFKGLVGREAEDFAARKVVDTQFITSAADMPLAFNNQAMRSLTQLATFSGKQAGFMQRMGVKMLPHKTETGKWSMDVKQTASILSAVVAATAMTEGLKPVIGMQESEWVPFYDQIAPFFGAFTGKAGASSSTDSLYRSPLVTLLAGDGKSKSGLIQALQTGDIEKFFGDQWSSLVPGGAQIKKSVEGNETTSTGLSKNSSGAIRYLQDTSADDKVKATLFGQYATDAGRNWIKEGFPTLSDSQTKDVEKQPNRAAQEQYADYYEATKQAPGRGTAYDKVKQAATAGDTNKATRLADEYNQQLSDSLSSYWKKHQDMPDDLKKDFTAKQISVSNIIDNINGK